MGEAGTPPPDPFGLVYWWRRLTRPHVSIQQPVQQRRARLAAGLLLLLIPAAAMYIVVYQFPQMFVNPTSESWPTIGALLAVTVGYALARGPRYQRGIWLTVGFLLLAIWGSFFSEHPHDATLLYFTLLPVLLAGLLTDLGPAVTITMSNLAVAAAVPVIEGGWPAAYVDAFLFVMAVSPLVLVGTSFLEKSVREVDDANRQLREADAFRLQLLNTVAHDLASPLTPMRLQLDILSDASKDIPKAVLEKRLGTMRRNVELMHRLVNDISDLSKAETGRLHMQAAACDLNDLAQHAVEAFTVASQARGVSLALSSPRPLPLQADPERVTQVIYNFFTNALKFTPHGGTIEVTLLDDPVTAGLRVKDSGRGLTAEEILRLWKPFSQVHQRHEVEERGTGLGLFISRRIVEAHGGSVSVQSDGHGTGSTFGFILPREGPAQPTVPLDPSGAE